MQVAGRPSWRFEEGDGGTLDLALFARDAARLEVPPATDIPPPLSVAIDRPLAPASAGPGYALCSAQFAADPAAARALLRAVFASRLGRT